LELAPMTYTIKPIASNLLAQSPIDTTHGWCSTTSPRLVPAQAVRKAALD